MFKRIWRIFSITKAIVLGTLILIVWGRSYFVADTITRGNATQFVSLSSAYGVVMVRFVHDGQPTNLVGFWHSEKSRDPDAVLKEMKLGQSFANSLGFAHRSVRAPDSLTLDIMVPHWFVFLLAIPSLIFWAIRKMMSAQDKPVEAWCPKCMMQVAAKASQCPQCGGMVAATAT